MPQKVTQVDEDGKVIRDDNPLDVGGDGFSRLEEVIHDVLDHLKVQTELLKEIAN